MASYSSSQFRAGGGGGGGGGISDSRYEADFQKLSTTIASNIQKILQNVSTMTRLVNQCGTSYETAELKKQLHQTRINTQQLVKDTDTLLKDLNSQDNRQLKIQKERLVDEFTASLTAFQAIQRKYVNFEKKQVQEARSQNVRIAKPPNSQQQQQHRNESLFEDNFADQRSPQQLQQIQQQEEIDLEALEEQERTIRELEENIVGVNEIYKKLGALVYEQGMVVDSIESSVEQTSVFVSEGTEQLRKASHYQNKVRKKKLILAVIVAGIVAIIIGLIVWQTR